MSKSNTHDTTTAPNSDESQKDKDGEKNHGQDLGLSYGYFDVGEGELGDGDGEFSLASDFVPSRDKGLGRSVALEK